MNSRFGRLENLFSTRDENLMHIVPVFLKKFGITNVLARSEANTEKRQVRKFCLRKKKKKRKMLQVTDQFLTSTRHQTNALSCNWCVCANYEKIKNDFTRARNCSTAIDFLFFHVGFVLVPVKREFWQIQNDQHKN